MAITERVFRYKYLPFNHNSLRIITEGTIKFTKPSELNDPFDCAPETKDDNLKEYLQSRPDLMDAVSKQLRVPIGYIYDNFDTFVKKFEKPVKEGVYGQPMSDNVGICSLTRDPLNLLMWAHYANDHAGFVAEFNIPLECTDSDDMEDNCLLDWLVPQVVEYSKDKPIIDFLDKDDVKLKKRFLIKGDDWKYENEERVLDHVRGPGIFKYDRNTILNCIIAGMKIKSDDFELLLKSISTINATQKLNIRLYKAKPVKGCFSLFVHGRSDLMPITVHTS